MSIKNELLDKINSFTTEKETVTFISDLFTVLHDINVKVATEMNETGVISEERAKLKGTQIDVWLRQANESFRDNLKMIALTKKLTEYNEIKAEKDNLASKVARAQEIINEKELEIEKAKKGTKSELKKKLQLGRDRIIAIAQTSTVLGKQINDNKQGVAVIDTLNNIRENVRLLTEEMSALGLWDDDEEKPNVIPIEAVEKHRTTSCKSHKKAVTKSDIGLNANESNIDNADEVDDFELFDKIKSPTKITKSVRDEQINIIEVQEDNSQEE